MSLLFTMTVITVVLMLVIGIYSLITTRNLMRILISLEILTKAATLFLICVGYLNGNHAVAQSLVITIIIIEVVLLVVATGILLGVHRANGTLNTTKLNNLKG